MTSIEIMENQRAWKETFRNNWLAALDARGVTDWSIYNHPRNANVPGTPGIPLASSRLMMITSAGAYLPREHEPFDAPNLYGDYSLRTFPSSTPLDGLAYAHGHYDQRMIEADPQVGLPLRHLHEMVEQGGLGSLAPSVVSFMGYQPDSARVVEEVVPRVVEIARGEEVDAALLAPV